MASDRGMSRRGMSQRLRALVSDGGIHVLPGVYNAITAKIAESAGFEAVGVSGYGVSASLIGQPDVGLTTCTEIVMVSGYVVDAVNVPVIADADTGFGNAINVGRTVKTLERSGANAIQLEDQDFPKRCGHFSGKHVIPRAEMVQKIHAAVDARNDPDLAIMARTDAIAVNGFEDAIERAAAYIEAGADITFVEAPRNEEQMREIPKRLKVPQLVNIVAGGLTPMVEFDTLAKMGFTLILYANAALQASVAGMQKVLGHLHARGSLDGIMPFLAGFEERQRLVSKPHFDALEKKYSAD
jgi:2-methylisocitrate lyase-like PEP mutase family enzyme